MMMIYMMKIIILLVPLSVVINNITLTGCKQNHPFILMLMARYANARIFPSVTRSFETMFSV